MLMEFITNKGRLIPKSMEDIDLPEVDDSDDDEFPTGKLTS